MANLHTFVCILHPPSNLHLVHFLFQVGLHVALSYIIALSYLDRHNEPTFVGAISSTSPKSEHFVLIITRFFVVRGTVILLYPPIAHESHVTRQSIRTSYP